MSSTRFRLTPPWTISTRPAFRPPGIYTSVSYTHLLDDLRLTKEYIQGVSRIFIVACGSSYHVGMVSKYNWERLLRRPVEVCLASE